MVRCLLSALLAASLLLPLARPEDSSSATTAYDELGLRGFPRGLLPANVRAYTLDAGSGDFAVDLRSSCHIVLPAGSYLGAFSDRLNGVKVLSVFGFPLDKIFTSLLASGRSPKVLH